ncbi:hypothetical protein RclHR1_00440025 [Rhizophagus clarus]|uniref:Protein kinase domain-containing protein n=1 Tax=Rhizophagus clarus TaxID=94130 RepID=A0A2Z6SBH8_9GLOM|nr:hypothetical protein RclHR1_00440025 [Rhizophagus clarus]
MYQDGPEQCKKCDEKYISKYGAKYGSCQIDNLKQNFTNWTSGSKKLDDLIQGMQLEINELDDMIFEWIPYNQFNDIKEISKEAFDNDKVYSAIWKDGPLEYDKYNNEYARNHQNTKDIKYSIAYISEVLRIYGISQCPNTKNCIIVFQEIFCKRCGKKYTNIIKKWCEPCQIYYFKENCLPSIITYSSFKSPILNVTIGQGNSLNEKIDCLIKEIQLKIDYDSDIVFEWIPYDQLNDIQEFDNDDFDIIHAATWKDGPLYYYDGEWTRKSNKVVTLKYLYNSQNIIKLLNKIKDDYLRHNYCSIYGITQNPDTKDYIMVFPNTYCEKCNEKYWNSSCAANEWCKTCQINNLKVNWTDGNEIIDNLIQEMQLSINNSKQDAAFECIPYDRFSNIKEICDNEYSAVWKDGPLNYNKIKDEYTRNHQYVNVVLKLYNFQNITYEFLNETIKDLNKYYGKIFGISRNPNTKDYIIVLRDGRSDKICEKCEWTRESNRKVFLQLYSLQDANEFLNEAKDYSKYDDLMYGISQDTKYYMIVFKYQLYCERCNEAYKGVNFKHKWCNKCEQGEQLKIVIELRNRRFEWIPYNQFNNIKKVNNDFTKMYSAIWENDLLYYDNLYKSCRLNLEVTLKYLQNITEEVNEYSVQHGISQDPDTKEYIIVVEDSYCKKCGNEYLYNEWGCKSCRINYLKSNFTNCTSGNIKIDNLIQEMQFKINEPYDPYGIIFKWIPYYEFSNIKEINKGGFATIYLATWRNGPLSKMVALKQLYESQKLTKEFLNEVKGYSTERCGQTLKIYGISQDPNT